MSSKIPVRSPDQEVDINDPPPPHCPALPDFATLITFSPLPRSLIFLDTREKSTTTTNINM